mmetsp:Transcript_60264/g.111763  ORF Transcript_60264/g.111763 Transcript_60264/m.111763 type:complete len:100 (-) Transcript_60264:990-1289(-)
MISSAISVHPSATTDCREASNPRLRNISKFLQTSESSSTVVLFGEVSADTHSFLADGGGMIGGAGAAVAALAGATGAPGADRLAPVNASAPGPPKLGLG